MDKRKRWVANKKWKQLDKRRTTNIFKPDATTQVQLIHELRMHKKCWIMNKPVASMAARGDPSDFEIPPVFEACLAGPSVI